MAQQDMIAAIVREVLAELNGPKSTNGGTPWSRIVLTLA